MAAAEDRSLDGDGDRPEPGSPAPDRQAPVHAVDLGPFRLGGPSDRQAIARLVDDACRDTGFLQVTGHGVSLEVCDRLLDAWAGFFDLPPAVKRDWVVGDESANRGFSAVGKEGLAYSRGEATPPDLFEAFNVGREDVVGPYFDRHRLFYAANRWPDRPPGLRDAWLAYEAGAAEAADTVLRAMAVALDLPEPWFVERTRRAVVTTRFINYERRSRAEPEPGQMRLGAHTDYGILTVLLADEVPGLQVWRDRRWHDVATPRGTLTCNIGDMLALWTNDRWTSTLHRVVPPSGHAEATARRRSVARFLDCEPDRVIECIPSCCGPANPPRFEPVQAGEWLMAKILGGRRRRPADLSAASAESAGDDAG
jgi:isopenicillin N synthase-like dioxygenase